MNIAYPRKKKNNKKVVEKVHDLFLAKSLVFN